MERVKNLKLILGRYLAVCHNKRIKRNRTFEGTAEMGKSTMGWFFGFKLHIAINEVLQNVSGKLFADKGYISKKLFEHLYEQGITLITSVKKKMKNRLIPLVDKLLLRKHSVIETVNDQLKNMCDIEHTCLFALLNR